MKLSANSTTGPPKYLCDQVVLMRPNSQLTPGYPCAIMDKLENYLYISTKLQEKNKVLPFRQYILCALSHLKH